MGKWYLLLIYGRFGNQAGCWPKACQEKEIRDDMTGFFFFDNDVDIT